MRNFVGYYKNIDMNFKTITLSAAAAFITIAASAQINIIGGGQIDGPSAGVAILAAILSALTGKPVRQDMAVTGEISIQGRVKAVGGVVEKAYGAKQAGITSMILPKENEKDIPAAHLGLALHPVATAEEAIRLLIGDITD